MINYNQSNWYWNVSGNASQVFSSASMSYVAVSDATYQAWMASGGVATRIAANDMLLLQIQILEESVTPRMLREAVRTSTATFTSGPYTGQTALQVITAIDNQIVTLRGELTN